MFKFRNCNSLPESCPILIIDLHDVPIFSKIYSHRGAPRAQGYLHGSKLHGACTGDRRRSSPPYLRNSRPRNWTDLVGGVNTSQNISQFLWNKKLVGGIATPLKNMKVTWDDDFQIGKIKVIFQSPPTSLFSSL